MMTTKKTTGRETPWMDGNANAQKDDVKATAAIHMRVTPDRKNRYVKQAQSEGKRLSEWMQDQLDEACASADKENDRRD